MKMNIHISRWRRLAAAIAVVMLTCGTPSHAWCLYLWVAFDDGGGIAAYTAGDLVKSGSPSPITLSLFPDATGLAFDQSKNLWAVVDGNEVVQFDPAQLKDLKHHSSPTPQVIITSKTFDVLYGCNFDHKGNLWVADYSNNSIDELSKAQLAHSADVTPALVITSSDLDGPNFVTFDKAGNAWVDNETSSTIAEFSASQLRTGGSKSPTVLLSDDGSHNLDAPGEIAFDKKGNLWVPSYDSNKVVEYAKDQLTSSGDPAATVVLSSTVFVGPWGAVFDSSGNLVVMNYDDGAIAKFNPKQLKTSGAPVPKVSLSGTEIDNYQIIFGPAS